MAIEKQYPNNFDVTGQTFYPAAIHVASFIAMDPEAKVGTIKIVTYANQESREARIPLPNGERHIHFRQEQFEYIASFTLQQLGITQDDTLYNTLKKLAYMLVKTSPELNLQDGKDV